MSKVAKVTGIPETTLSSWKRSDWWEPQLVEVRSQIGETILANNLKIATRSGEEVLDRIDNGSDLIFNLVLMIPEGLREQDLTRLNLLAPFSLSHETERVCQLTVYRLYSARRGVDLFFTRPSKTSAWQGILHRGRCVVVLRKKRNWTLIETFDRQKEKLIRGWVFSRYLRRLR